MRERWTKDWDRRSPDERQAAQLRRLKTFLRYQVLPFSPFYQRLFRDAGVDPANIQSLRDFQQLPFTSKDLIAPTADEPQRPRDLILQPTPEIIRAQWPLSWKLRLLWNRLWQGESGVRESLEREYRPVSMFFTTGRSALPTLFTLTNYDLALLEEVGRRILQVADIGSRDKRLLNLFPYAPHLAFWQVYYVGIGSNVLTLNTGGGKVMGTEGILQSIERIRPSFIIGIPGYVYHVLREAHSRSMDLSFVEGLALGGDQVTPGYRSRVKELLVSMGATKPRVQSVLGFTESRKCWAECPGEADAGFHTYPDFEIVELIDPESGNPVGEGETGELVYSCIDGRGSCILRYRTGDLIVGGMTWKPCPHCGRTVPRLASQLERVSNLKNFQLSKVKGTLVNLNVFKEELDNDPVVEEWQLVIKKRNDDPCDVDEIHLNLALAGDVSDTDQAAVVERLEKHLFSVSEVKLNSTRVLALEKVLELLGMETQMKEKRIVDLRTETANATTTAAAQQPVKP